MRQRFLPYENEVAWEVHWCLAKPQRPLALTLFTRHNEEASAAASPDTGLDPTDWPFAGQDHFQRGQSRRQEVVRRPLVQLQQVGQTGGQYHGPTDSQNQAQAITAHRCGKSNKKGLSAPFEPLPI